MGAVEKLCPALIDYWHVANDSVSIGPIWLRSLRLGPNREHAIQSRETAEFVSQAEKASGLEKPATFFQMIGTSAEPGWERSRLGDSSSPESLQKTVRLATTIRASEGFITEIGREVLRNRKWGRLQSYTVIDQAAVASPNRPSMNAA